MASSDGLDAAVLDLGGAWESLADAVEVEHEGSGKAAPDVLRALDELTLKAARAREDLVGARTLLGAEDRRPLALAHLPSPEVAIATIRSEHNRLCDLIMMIIDLLGDVQEARETVKLGNLRKAAGSTMRNSLQAREDALAVLAEVA